MTSPNPTLNAAPPPPSIGPPSLPAHPTPAPAAIASAWQVLTLDMAEYKSTHKLRSTEEIFSALEENTVTLSTMKVRAGRAQGGGAEGGGGGAETGLGVGMWIPKGLRV